MLQKLLIALCTVFVLSACGGDLDLGPDQAPPPDNGDNGDDGDGGDDGDDFEPGEPQRWEYNAFNDAESTATWSYRCVDGCNATAELSWLESEAVLAVAPAWAGDEDELEIYTSIEEIDDMEGANISVWVYVTEAYLTDGNMTMHLMLSNASDQRALTRAYEADQVGWNQIDIWEIEAGTGEADPEAEDPETIDYGSFAWHSEGFTLEDINEVGVQFAANGKSSDVSGELWLDNLLLTPSSGSAPQVVGVTDGWFSKGAYNVEGDVAADPVYGDGFVSLQVDKPNQQLVKAVAGPGSYGAAEVTFTLSLDAAYLDSADGFQPFGQVFNDTDPEGYADDEEVGGEWGCWTGHGGITADEEFDVTCIMTDEELFEVNEEQYVLFGVQSQTDGVAGTIRIHSIEIEGASGSGEEDIIELEMTEGWRVSDEFLNLTYTDDGVAYSPSADSEYNQLLYDLSGPIDLSGATYEVVFSVDEDFKAGGRAVQPIAQGNPDFGTADYNCYVGSGSLTAGEDYTVECPALSDAFNFEGEDQGVQIGIQIAGEGQNQGTVTIKSLTINLD